MSNITGTHSIRHDAPMTLTNISETFKNAGDNQNVRFSDAKGLHTHSKYGKSMVDFLAFFRNPAALEQRREMRENGMARIKDSIDAELGPGMGQRVFDRMGLSGRTSVTVGELRQMSEVATKELENNLGTMVDRVGALDPYQFFLQCHDKLGMGSGDTVYKSYDVNEMDLLLGKMALAVVPMEHTTTEACARVATGEVIKHNLLKHNEQSTHPFNQDQLVQLNLLLGSCFDPGGANTEFKPHHVYAALLTHCQNGTLPTPEQLRSSLETRSVLG